MARLLLALDQGTTSSRSILFDEAGKVVGQSQEEFPQILPTPGHVEHDPEAIWESQLGTAKRAIAEAGVDAKEIAAIGITNQRETTILWDRHTGRPIGNAIVWQSRISSAICQRMKQQGCEETIRGKTGLVVDAYFSATKIMYLLEQDAALRRRAEDGDVLFGTVDSFLIWRLTGGRRHVTDVSNASRTMLFNIHDLQWDEELLKLCQVPIAMLPEVLPTCGFFGETDAALFGATIPIMAAAGDQQAATFGQVCFETGTAKNTYGTGCFLVMNIGDEPVASQHGLLTTVGWQIDGKVTYCLEGSVFIGGAVIQWLRDGLGIVKSAAEAEQLASTVADAAGVVLVPAFVGLGAPHWDPHARGGMFGITRGTTAVHIARAALESIAFQSAELVQAMRQDARIDLKVLRVDGGACANDVLMQFQADLLDCQIQRPKMIESTAWGAASLAGLAAGIWPSFDELRKLWLEDQSFLPRMNEEERSRRFRLWKKAVERVRDWELPA